MPLHLIAVERVDSGKTSNPRVTSYLVTGETVEEPSRTMQFETIHDLRASLCQRAKDTGRYIWIAWKDGRYGKDIVTVQLDDTTFSYDEQPRERVI